MVVTPEEAELAKLFTNTWRYIKFAAANQFWEMANDAGLDFARIRRRAITFDYARASDLPGPGFAAGPCLFKDAMQLSAFARSTSLWAVRQCVNEGMPLYVVDRLADRFDLENMTVGMLGMAFKARLRRPTFEPLVQAEADPTVQGEARSHVRSLCDDRLFLSRSRPC